MTGLHHGGETKAARAALAASCVALLAVTACSSSKPKSAPTTGSATSNTSVASAPSNSSAVTGVASSSASSSALTACSLATNADVKNVYGEDFGTAQASTPGGYSTCLFPPPIGGIDQVSFTVATGSQAQLFYTTNQSVYTGKAIAQLGDKAFVSDDGGAIGVLSGDTAFLVHLVGFEKVPPTTLQVMQENFAKLLLARLR